MSILLILAVAIDLSRAAIVPVRLFHAPESDRFALIEAESATWAAFLDDSDSSFSSSKLCEHLHLYVGPREALRPQRLEDASRRHRGCWKLRMGSSRSLSFYDGRPARLVDEVSFLPSFGHRFDDMPEARYEDLNQLEFDASTLDQYLTVLRAHRRATRLDQVCTPRFTPGVEQD